MVCYFNEKQLTFAADRYWLYDLSKDIGEKNNLAGSHPENIKQLTEQYQKWNSQNTDPAWPALSSKTMSGLSVDDIPIEWVFWSAYYKEYLNHIWGGLGYN